ncbi:MAG: DUF1015 domain-containing protein [Actinomycetota bacterium]
MPAISPFTGLLYDPAVAGSAASLTAPPYDTVGADDRRTLARDPHNIVHVDLPQPRPGDDRDDNEYTRAASTLSSWRDAGVLRETPTTSTFPYEMSFTADGRTRRIRGLIASVDVQPWGAEVTPHEEVAPGPVQDRLELLRAVRTNLSPVYALFPGPRRGLASFLDAAADREPDVELTDADGTRHRLWVVPGDAPDVPDDEVLLIADGHHRYTTALRYREQMRAAHGPGPWDRIMMLLVDVGSEHPPVLPIHRVSVVTPPPALHGEQTGRKQALQGRNDEHPTVAVVTSADDGPVWSLARLEGSPPAVRALHADPGFAAQMDRGDVRFTHDAAEAEEAVRRGDARAAYLLPPTSAERIAAAVAAKERMPQKSTFFWPKPRTGMVLRPLVD